MVDEDYRFIDFFIYRCNIRASWSFLTFNLLFIPGDVSLTIEQPVEKRSLKQMLSYR